MWLEVRYSRVIGCIESIRKAEVCFLLCKNRFLRWKFSLYYVYGNTFLRRHSTILTTFYLLLRPNQWRHFLLGRHSTILSTFYLLLRPNQWRHCLPYTQVVHVRLLYLKSLFLYAQTSFLILIIFIHPLMCIHTVIYFIHLQI